MERNTLGMAIGIITDNFSLKNDAGETVQMRLKFDFTSSTDQEIKSWLCGNRRIAFQRPARGLSKSELLELNGTVIPASDAGKKVKSLEEKISEKIKLGLPRDVAVIAVKNPARFEKLMKMVDEAASEIDDELEDEITDDELEEKVGCDFENALDQSAMSEMISSGNKALEDGVLDELKKKYNQ